MLKIHMSDCMSILCILNVPAFSPCSNIAIDFSATLNLLYQQLHIGDAPKQAFLHMRHDFPMIEFLKDSFD